MKHLSEVKAEGCRDIQVRVNVVDIVKTPKEREGVIDPMPIVKGKVHEQEPNHHFEGCP